MTIHDSLQAVLDSGMCVACGACCAADPSLSMVLNRQRQLYEPNGSGGAAAAAVCPAIEVDYRRLHHVAFGSQPPGPLGCVDAVFLAQSTDEDRNRRASSGGLIKETMIYLLETGAVDGIVSIVHERGLEYSAQTLRERAEVDRLPGSIYHNIDLSSALALIESRDERLALAAIPCQLEGIYSYISLRRPELRQRIVFTIGLLCAWQYTRHSLTAICSYKGVDPNRLTDVAYRGGDMLGKLRLRLDDGRELEVDRRASLDYQIAFDRYFNTPRCNVCVNHLNWLADLVVGDSWMQSTRFTRTGVSIALARNARAAAALREMEQRGQLALYPVSEKELIESEGESLVYGEFAYALADLRRALGLHSPRLNGPNMGFGNPARREVVAAFQQGLEARQRLLAEGRYRRIWWLKVLRQGHRIAWRYLKWFINRVVRLKRLTGQDRELSRSELRERFR